MHKAVLLISAVTACLIVGTLSAGEKLQAPETIAQAVDHFLAVRQQQEGVSPAPLVGDAQMVRRVMLDLAGRIPSAAEARDYAQSQDPEKRAKLVDRLLASPDFVRHQRNELDLMLMGDRNDNDWRAYLLKAVETGRSWDKIFRDVLQASESDEELKGAASFVKSRAGSLDDLTNDTSILFFGVNVSCAKCHDHPLVADWTQDHYFGMASFFNRTYLTKKKKLLAERNGGIVKFKTVEGEERVANMMFLTGTIVQDPPSLPTDAGANKNDESAPPPLFSRREQLVAAALQPGNEMYLARSITNRTWARLFGRGLVTPVDQMHSANPPSHPQLMDWLASDFVAHGFELKRLIRGLVLSDAYGRSSRWESAEEHPHEKLFATGPIRPLNPRQYAISLLMATSDQAQMPSGPAVGDWPKRLEQLESLAAGYAQLFEIPGPKFQVSVTEALLLSNSEKIQNELLRDAGDSIVGKLKAIEDHEELVRTAVWSVLSREPDAEEMAAFKKFLADRKDRLPQACQQLVWILLTSAEFRFNY